MNQEEFKSVFNKYFDAVRNYIYYRSGDQEIATDIAQDTFIILWEKQLDSSDKIKALLFKIAGDIFVSQYRRTQTALKFSAHHRNDSIVSNPEEILQFNELQQRFEHALTQMPENQRMVYLMHRMEKLTYPEMAERLDLSVKAIEKRMSQALAFLRTKLA
ncbi:MAG: sigma-70 family RNA polymerase sigma factor [Bacteroidales bacterium]|nr:sigma-70 family RNA polymerase sigma factor [Bacteroidales bacterium]